MCQSPGHNRCSVIVPCGCSFQIQEGIIPSLLNGWHFLPVVDDSAAQVLCQQPDTLMACFNLSHSLLQVFNIPTVYRTPHFFSCARMPFHSIVPAHFPICCLKFNVTDFFLFFPEHTLSSYILWLCTCYSLFPECTSLLFFLMHVFSHHLQLLINLLWYVFQTPQKKSVLACISLLQFLPHWLQFIFQRWALFLWAPVFCCFVLFSSMKWEYLASLQAYCED